MTAVPRAPLALGVDPAAVRLDQVLDDREAEPGPALFARARGVGPVESLEDAGQVVPGDPRRRYPRMLTAIPPRLRRLRQMMRPPGWRVAERVVEQVGEDLAQGVEVRAHGSRHPAT